jgi:hypothetical protein
LQVDKLKVENMGHQHGNLPASGIFRRLLDCSDDTKALAKSTTAGFIAVLK